MLASSNHSLAAADFIMYCKIFPVSGRYCDKKWWKKNAGQICLAAQSVCSQQLSEHPSATLGQVPGAVLGVSWGSVGDPYVVKVVGSRAAAETTLIVLFLSAGFLLKVLSAESIFPA